VKKASILHLLLAILLLACTSAKQVLPANEGVYTLEQFGGQAWYLPADGRLQVGIQYPLINFTPAGADASFLKGLGLKGTNYTLISVQGNANFFPDDIVGKSFCGLFAHQNPSTPDYTAVDAFYPQELGSRYAKVVHRIDGKNVIVDFEYNGGNERTPQRITSGKGYFFLDNSEAWDKLRQAVTAPANRIEEVKLRGFEIKNNVQALYVVPQYTTWNFRPTNCKMWSGTKNIPAIKIGFEDYYQHEKAFGKSVVNQPEYLFNLPGGEHNHNLVINAKIYPPHRTILEASTYKRSFFVGRKAGGVTALVGATQFDEERFVKAGKGITQETFISWSFSAISGGGRLTDAKNGVLQDVQAYGYVLCKNYEQRAPYFTQMNGHAGNYLVVEDANLIFEPQADINPPSQALRIKVNSSATAYAGFPQQVLTRKDNYLPYTFEIDGKGNFFKVFVLGGSFRTNLISIQGSKSVLTFLMNAQGVRADNPGEFVGYWEFCFVPGKEKFDWGWKNGVPAMPARTASKMMLYEQIPQKGRRYTISRDYIVNESFEQLIDNQNARVATVDKNAKTASKKPGKGKMYSNIVRTAVAWTTVLNKYATDIDPTKDVPANGKPLALQPGDQFKIPAYKGSTHNPNEIYTVERKDRATMPMNPAEFVGIKNRSDWPYVAFSNAQSYRYFWCQLDKDLPQSVGIVFEIEMVTSMAEELLDGKTRDAFQTYKSLTVLGQNGTAQPNSQNAQGFGGYDVTATLTGDVSTHNPKTFFRGEALGHLCYSQVEITEWYKNVQWNNGYYRQNTNSGRGFETYDVKNAEGKPEKVNPLARYSAGKTFINCSGGPVGQYSDRLDDFQLRDWINTTHGKPRPENQKAKMRLYNSPKVRTQGVQQPEKYLETYPTDKGAPDMPKECREVLDGLKIN
jgi:hypothetical protein